MDIVEPRTMAQGVSGQLMRRLGWVLNRLRAMSPAEIVYRGRQWLGQCVERMLIVSGWQPQASQTVGVGCNIFRGADGWSEAWRARFSLDVDALNELMAGEIRLFGRSPLNVGTPVKWRRDPLTGIEGPLTFGKSLNYRDGALVGDVKFVWELGRHQHLVPLAVAYAYSGNRRYRDAVAEQIEGWIEQNPYGLGIHWCSSLELALRLISWAMVHALCALRDGARGLFAAVANPERLGNSIYQQARFVRHHQSRYSSANNHLIGELTGLWVATQVFDLGAEGDRWGAHAQRELEREARAQVHRDGVNKEQAFYYHLWVLEYLLVAWLIGVRSDRSFSREFRERIIAMAQFLADVGPSGIDPPQIGDADNGFVTRFDPRWPKTPYSDVLAAVECTLSDNPSMSSPKLPEKAFWYAVLGGVTAQRPGISDRATACPKKRPVVYPNGGYAILGDSRVHLVFDAGPLGYPSIAAHGHADALSLCLAVDGIWWLVDPGTYAYHTDRTWRDYFRGTRAHNTLVVDERDQAQAGGPFLWLTHVHGRFEHNSVDAGGQQIVEGTHDGYVSLGVVHRRRIAFDSVSGSITVTDNVEGSGERAISLCFHFLPGTTVEPGATPAIWVARRDGVETALVFGVDPDFEWEVVAGATEPILGWYSPALGTKVPAPALIGRRRQDAPASVVTRIELLNVA